MTGAEASARRAASGALYGISSPLATKSQYDRLAHEMYPIPFGGTQGSPWRLCEHALE
jgi:hypothetical protein